MPLLPTGSPHPVQLALWGEGHPLHSASYQCGIHFDKASIGISESTDDMKPRVIERLAINGETRPLTRYPIFQKFKKRSVVRDLPSFDALPSRTEECPYCHTSLEIFETFERGDDSTDRAAGELLEYCKNCTFWQVHGLRMEGFEARSTLIVNFYISVLSAKVREFEGDCPEGSLSEISQWLRRHPEKYQTVTPRYLERLVASVFRDIGIYTEVHHVGRPGDGGVDVLLVDTENKSWLVQVKRREYASSSEPVSTVRNILGTMVVRKARHAIVVSTADRFTHQARQEASQARESAFIVELIDRHALDLLVGQSMPTAPWIPILKEIRDTRNSWINEDWCLCGCTDKLTSR